MNLNELSKEELLKLLTAAQAQTTQMAEENQRLSEQAAALSVELTEKEQKLTEKEQALTEKEQELQNTSLALQNAEEKLLSTENELQFTKDELEKERAKAKKLHIRLEELIAKYEDKSRAYQQLQAQQFIPKSEKLPAEESVINEVEQVRYKKKRKTPSENFLAQLKQAYRGPQDDIVIDFDFAAHGVDPATVTFFDTDETYKLEVEPPRFTVKKIIKPKYRDAGNIYEADSSYDPFPHSPLTFSLGANILNMKFLLGVPFYRYSSYLNQLGFTISEANICHWAEKCMELLEPLYERMFEALINNPTGVLHIDETPLKVLNEDKQKCYMFVYTTSFWEAPIYIYSFSNTRSTKETKDILKDYKGYVVCDAYSGYDSLPDMGIKVQRCFVHARRYFSDVIKGLDEELQKESPAYKVLTLMAKIFKHEANFREKNYTAEKIRAERNKPYYQNCIKAVDKYIAGIDAENNEKLRKAVNYYQNNRAELYTYLENGYVDMSNNLAERTVKPFVIARKNFLFCKTDNGANITSKLFSIVQTARANGLKTEEYLAYCLENICRKPIDDLVPWNTQLPSHLKISWKDVK